MRCFPPSKPGRYRVFLSDGGPFPEAIVRWTGNCWKYERGWPAYSYLQKYISGWVAV